MKILDLGLDFDRIQFYKPLASPLHPAGAFSLVETEFLELFIMCPITFLCFVVLSCVYKPWVSKLHPAGAFSLLKIAFLEISSMGIAKKASFFSWGL